ncbi:MAG: glutamine synthetase [Myxococcales bacterium]|nr:glutamine synthetase [Myxococcales bacterium]
MNTPRTAEEVLREVAMKGDRRVKVAITDIDGVLRGKYIHLEKLRSALDGGFGFCDVVFGWDSADVCYDNSAFTGWHTGYPDAQVRLDPGTFRRIPWEDGVPFMLGDFEESDGGPLAVCPRKLLRRVLAKAEAMGYSAKVGMEFEWFNFRETPESLHAKHFARPTPITPGMFGYSVLRSSQNSEYFRDLMELTADFRVPLEGLHTETGPGVFEAAIMVDDALEAADRAVLFKSSAKEIAYRHGVMASFMAKWNAQLPGCSGHMHQSLWANDRNAFFEAGAEHRMSPVFRSYLAGQMKLLPEFTAFFAPTINSYKRLVDGMWAPTRVTWGVENRTVALRVIPGSNKSTRLETRVPGSDVNPYIAVATAIAAGLYGIEHGLDLPEGPIKGNGYEAPATVLPRNLDQATTALERSTIARELFGDRFVDHYVASRRWEWRQYCLAVTDYELQRYFEII